MTAVLVTGGSGYVATQLIAALLKRGTPVRTTVRSLDREAALRAAVRRGGGDESGLQVVSADLTEDAGWADALDGVTDVYHVATPFPSVMPSDSAELVGPARDGTLRVLSAATRAGARRVVLTSSFAAVGYSAKANAEYDERDWTDPDTPDLPAYPLSKTVAERAGWDYVEATENPPELVSVNPTFILGPTLTADARASIAIVKAMLDGAMPAVRKQRFGLVDVRDVADAHILAMTTPAAAGERFLVLADGPTISFLHIADVLRDNLGELAARAPTEEAPGDEPPNLVIHNEKAKRILGFAPRPTTTTIIETAENLRDLGLLEPQD
jgi:nucleoside-diphosphate-sugar epimerase